MGNEIMEYARYVRQVTDGVHWELKDPKQTDPEPLITFGDRGLPIFPPKRLGISGVATQQSLVKTMRAYLTAHYRECPHFHG